MNIRLILPGLAVLAAINTVPMASRAQVFVTSQGSGNIGEGIIGEYTTSGAPINATLISGLTAPQGIAVSGDKLFVTNRELGTIGEYTTSGASVNPALIGSLSFPEGIAVSGDKLFVATGLGILEYTTSGAEVAFPLIPLSLIGPSNIEIAVPFGIAVSGDKLFVTSFGSGENRDTIGEYTTSGATVDRELVTGLNGATGIAVSGENLFVVNRFSQTIGKYTTSGATVDPAFITGLNSPLDVAVAGEELYVTNTFTVGKYDATTGAPIDTTFIANLPSPNGVAVATSSSVPDTTSSWTLMLLGLGGIAGLKFSLGGHGGRAGNA